MTNRDKTDFEYIKTIISFCGIAGLNEQGLARLQEIETKYKLGRQASSTY